MRIARYLAILLILFGAAMLFSYLAFCDAETFNRWGRIVMAALAFVASALIATFVFIVAELEPRV